MDVKIETESPPGDSYRWEVPGKPVSVEIDLDVVDRLEAEVMQAFGAVPRRGLEVGGILLGTAEGGEYPRVRIEDFEPVLSKHEQGPSYVLTGKDLDRLEAALDRWQPEEGRRMRVVGFYRSHTREGLCLDEEDIGLLSRYFPEETAVALVVKPYATRPPVAGLFFREEGAIRSESSYREFSFRRRELAGGESGTSQAREAPTPDGAHVPTADLSGFPPNQDFGHEKPPEEVYGESYPPDSAVPRRSVRLQGGWVWIPLSFIFLLLGTVLGFQVALSVRSEIAPGPGQDPYALHLSATPTDDSVHVRWDRSSPVLREAQSGTLEITEGDQRKTVELDLANLRNGSVIYRRASDEVEFRLEVSVGPHASVSETIRFQAPTGTAQRD